MIRIDVDDFKILCRRYGLNDFTEGALETLFEYLDDDGIEMTFDPAAIHYAWGNSQKKI